MTDIDIIRMAKEASGDDWGIFRDFMPEIERFAKLVADFHKPNKEWVGLTDEEMLEIWNEQSEYRTLFKKVEKKFMEKNFETSNV